MSWSISLEYARIVAVEQLLVFKSLINWVLAVENVSGLVIKFQAEEAYNNSQED